MLWRSSHEGAWPRATSTDAEGKRLGVWITNHARRSERDGARDRILDEMASGWRDVYIPVRPPRRLPPWGDTLYELARWMRGHPCRLPSVVATDATELRLATWVENQRSGRSVTPSRTVFLDVLCSGWRGKPTRSWEESLARIVSWRAAHPGQWPFVRSADAEERSLANWLSDQRTQSVEALRLAREPILTTELPGWDSLHRQRWDDTLDAVVAWRALRYGEWPAMSATDAEELLLARWLGTQRSGRNLSDERLRRLDERVEGWRSPQDERWRAHLDAFARWCRTHPKRCPSVYSVDLMEKRFGAWRRAQIDRARRGVLAPGRRSALDDRVPGWDSRSLDR